MSYYTYMLRCKDDTIYTGMAADLERRMQEHFSQNEKCAKYTLVHTPQKLEMAWESETRAMAMKLEFHIKKLSKAQKEELIKKPRKIKEFLEEKVDYKNYTVVDVQKW